MRLEPLLGMTLEPLLGQDWKPKEGEVMADAFIKEMMAFDDDKVSPRSSFLLF